MLKINPKTAVKISPLIRTKTASRIKQEIKRLMHTATITMKRMITKTITNRLFMDKKK